MKTRTLVIAVLATLAQTALAESIPAAEVRADIGVAGDASWDGLRAGFETILSRAPSVQSHAFRGATRPCDEARTGEATSTAWDGLRASFETILRSAPSVLASNSRDVQRTLALSATCPGDERQRGAPLAGASYQAWDGLRASFDAMLNHPPHHGPTATTVGRADDHLIEQLMHASLRRPSAPVRMATAAH
jgi:hypothetical protein